MDNRRPSDCRRQGQIRQDLVDRIRREIAAGTYETPEKLQAALERLLQRLKAEQL